jgi:hypothetical protein
MTVPSRMKEHSFNKNPDHGKHFHNHPTNALRLLSLLQRKIVIPGVSGVTLGSLHYLSLLSLFKRKI